MISEAKFLCHKNALLAFGSPLSLAMMKLFYIQSLQGYMTSAKTDMCCGVEKWSMFRPPPGSSRGKSSSTVALKVSHRGATSLVEGCFC